jgi:hypothetical protein
VCPSSEGKVLYVVLDSEANSDNDAVICQTTLNIGWLEISCSSCFMMATYQDDHASGWWCFSAILSKLEWKGCNVGGEAWTNEDIIEFLENLEEIMRPTTEQRKGFKKPSSNYYLMSLPLITLSCRFCTSCWLGLVNGGDYHKNLVAEC